MIPKQDDSQYFIAGDDFSSISIGAVVAMPIDKGSFLAFSHRTVHWGSQVRATASAASPRIALSLAFADPSFETAYFDESHLPCPPMGLRLGLVAAQLIQYHHFTSASTSPMVPATKKMKQQRRQQLLLYSRIFHAQKRFFLPEYFDKISSRSQFLKFMGE
mmetsp:Transcript_14880/g.20384  ORF Transcript_14880/g.20384 Transcript_14880/m.20384 type:complete len:161 (+) Transcript_14880:414-896(+)